MLNTTRIKVLTSKNMTYSEMEFIAAVGRHLAKRYKVPYETEKFNLVLYADYGRITVAYDAKDRPIGLMMARLYRSIFDGTTRILIQDLLYARPGSRASKVLLDDFIDFGRHNADHVLTVIGEHTCIKPSSLTGMGFKELETIYRMET